MDEVRSTPAAQRQNQSQIRRAQLGVVAGYIHEMAERHSEPAATSTSGNPGRPGTPLGSISR
jgi:hypothetical protein